MVTQVTNLSLSAKRECLARIHGRYPRAGRPHKTRILEKMRMRSTAELVRYAMSHRLIDADGNDGA